LVSATQAWLSLSLTTRDALPPGHPSADRGPASPGAAGRSGARRPQPPPGQHGLWQAHACHLFRDIGTVIGTACLRPGRRAGSRAAGLDGSTNCAPAGAGCPRHWPRQGPGPAVPRLRAPSARCAFLAVSADSSAEEYHGPGPGEAAADAALRNERDRPTAMFAASSDPSAVRPDPFQQWTKLHVRGQFMVPAGPCAAPARPSRRSVHAARPRVLKVLKKH
jgi:hypothetical protein